MKMAIQQFTHLVHGVTALLTVDPSVAQKPTLSIQTCPLWGVAK
jgi:hypothetical protein